MAIIYSYPLKTTVKNSDQFVISVAPTSGVGALETNSITFETLKDSILTGQTSGTVTSVTATSPLTGGTITDTGSIGITQASSSADGYLSSTDWTTFNNKQSTSEKGQANGYAPLNSSTKLDIQYIPDALVGAVIYKGTWNADTNTPTLPTPAPANQGFYYVVSARGTIINPYGFPVSYEIGDWAISNGAEWEKVDNTQSVISVNGLYGYVSLTTSDINEGTNLYYTEARVSANTNVAANTAKVSFPGFGTTAGTALEGNTVIPTVPANIVETVTTTDGTFIDLTPDVATDGAVTVTADLSATGVANNTTFLRGDNTWAVPSGGGGGGVTFDYTDSGTNLIIGESLTYTTQQGNVGLGEGVLENQTGSSYNTAIGYQSLQHSISGAGHNTALGYRALQGVSTVTAGNDNTAVGYEAGMRILSASNNVFIGNQAGDRVTHGNSHVIIGDGAGGAATIQDENVIIGQLAAAQYLGNRSVIIGKSANNLASQTGTNNTVIGFNAQQSSTTVNNEITIGNTTANSLRLPGLQASASDGDVLTYSSSSDNIILQSPFSQTKGTYTPELVCSNSDFTVNTYSIQVGRWIRVGNVVTCEFSIRVNLGDITITNTASTASVKIRATPYDAITTSSPVTGYISHSRGFESSLSDVIVLTGSSYPGNLNFQPALKSTLVTNYYLPDDLRVNNFANVGSTFDIMGSYTYVTNTSTLNSGAAIT